MTTTIMGRMSHAAALPTRWIVSREFDLSLFFGGAALSLLFLALALVLRAPIVALWWIWLLAFDGPHIGAAFTRTYLDRQEWMRRPGMLAGSLATFLIGPLALAIGVAAGSDAPFLLFLGFATLYGYYHVVRQHWGFVSLYNARNGARDPGVVRLDQLTLYLGSWLPYVFFVLSHPRARTLIGLSNDPSALERALLWSLVAAWLATLVRFAAVHLRKRSFGEPKVAYLLITVLLHGAIYFGISRFEPVYGSSNGPDQDFLLISILTVIFHNVQYLGLVWFHNRNRYAASTGHGLAHLVNRSPAFFIAACALFSAVIYFGAACGTGAFPGCAPFVDRRLGPVSWNQIGLSLWWGLAMNHYVLDQKIWRVRGDRELRQNLRLA
jgi:hypothetical protein